MIPCTATVHPGNETAGSPKMAVITLPMPATIAGQQTQYPSEL